jgi:hypothetical protein
MLLPFVFSTGGDSRSLIHLGTAVAEAMVGIWDLATSRRIDSYFSICQVVKKAEVAITLIAYVCN